jgi:hypothetical protein
MEVKAVGMDYKKKGKIIQTNTHKTNVHQGIPQGEHDKSLNYSTCPTTTIFNNNKKLPIKLSPSHPSPFNNHDYINNKLVFMVSYSFFSLQFLLPPLLEPTVSF